MLCSFLYLKFLQNENQSNYTLDLAGYLSVCGWVSHLGHRDWCQNQAPGGRCFWSLSPWSFQTLEEGSVDLQSMDLESTSALLRLPVVRDSMVHLDYTCNCYRHWHQWWAGLINYMSDEKHSSHFAIFPVSMIRLVIDPFLGIFFPRHLEN